MEPNVGLKLATLRSRPELRSRVGRTTDGAAQDAAQSSRNHNKGSCSCLCLAPSASWATLVLPRVAPHGVRYPLLLGSVGSDHLQDLEATINHWIHLEFCASCIYPSTSFYFDHDELALRNVATDFPHQTHKERDRAEKLMAL
ncbi:ferritin, mitochondrial-like [Callorhinus ursinus]|uniref:ferritin, mitochondrial-like n=1 Tax=Callorhinus ursinus TaxID=34884 RepID=UPI003CD037BB